MIYVLSDIHGNMTRYNSIMEQISLQKTDTLYILGDVIDRCPDGIKILRQIMKCDNIKMLLGNHEYMMLEVLAPYRKINEQEYAHLINLWYRNGGEVTHNYLKHIRKEHRVEIFNYLKSLPLEFEVTVNGKKFLLVHASPAQEYNKSTKFKNETEFALWNRWHRGNDVPKGYTLIFGHTPTYHYRKIKPYQIWKEGRAIDIDCGCGYSEGRLACLRLDDMKEFYAE